MYSESDASLTEDYFEYERGPPDIIVKRILKSHIQVWKDISSYPFIIDVTLVPFAVWSW